MLDKKDIDRVIQKGFEPLPVDPDRADKAVKRVYALSDRVEERKKRLLFFPAKLVYAAAACFFLFIGSGVFLAYMGGASDTENAGADEKGDIRENRITFISGVGNTEEISEAVKDSVRHISTDSNTQVLISVGQRSRVIVFENSELAFDMNSHHTDLELYTGSIVVDVEPKGRDTVSVNTPDMSFRQIGTRFAVFTDSASGSCLEVYRGRVSVVPGSGSIKSIKKRLIVDSLHAWSSSGSGIQEIDRESKELTRIEKALETNTIDRYLEFHRDQSKKEHCYNNRSLSDTGSAAESPGSIDLNLSEAKESIKKMLTDKDFNGLDSLITTMCNHGSNEDVYTLLNSLTEQMVAVFRFQEAETLLSLVSKRGEFISHQRENAWMKRYFLHKKHLGASHMEQLDMIRDYKSAFPEGDMMEDMRSAEIDLLLLTEKYKAAAEGMRDFLNDYQDGVRNEYYTYLYSATLREHLRDKEQALKGYKRYIERFPEGKYAEDALYWIVRLSDSLNDDVSVKKYRRMYLSKFPEGRWSDAVEKLGSNEG